MEKQLNLTNRPYKQNKVIPEVKVMKNTYMSAAGMIREIVIRKTYFIPRIVT